MNYSELYQKESPLHNLLPEATKRLAIY